MIPRHLKITAAVMLVTVGGLSLSLWRLKRDAVGAQPTGEPAHVAPPVSGPTENVTLYVAYDDQGLLYQRSAAIPMPSGRQQRAEEVLRALLTVYNGPSSPHALASGSEVRVVFLVDPGLAVIDLNSTFADGHRSGIMVEELTVLSLVQTLSANVPGITRVKILVDGKPRETLAGHADLSVVYGVSDVEQTVNQMKTAQ